MPQELSSYPNPATWSQRNSKPSQDNDTTADHTPKANPSLFLFLSTSSVTDSDEQVTRQPVELVHVAATCQESVVGGRQQYWTQDDQRLVRSIFSEPHLVLTHVFARDTA
nr:hypothetical protein L204_04586 [Cryptococcus depauperatus CBS 7855]